MQQATIHIEPQTEATGELNFASVVQEYEEMVYNIVLGIIQQEQDAEDLLQEVFVKLYEEWESFKGASVRQTWIYKVAVNTALDGLRKTKAAKRGGLLKRVFGATEDEAPKSFHHPGVALDQKENASLLFSALGKIPEKQRVAFLLQQLEGQSVKAIADILETSESAAESLLKRARENLRTILGKQI